MDERLEKIEQEIKTITERNHRVEADKAWGDEPFRLLCIAVVAYFVAAFLLYVIDAEHYTVAARLSPPSASCSPCRHCLRSNAGGL